MQTFCCICCFSGQRSIGSKLLCCIAKDRLSHASQISSSSVRCNNALNGDMRVQLNFLSDMNSHSGKLAQHVAHVLQDGT